MELHARFLIQDENTVLENCIISIQNGIIKEITPSKECKGNNIVMPGFVNAHTHAAMYSLRGYSDNLHLQDWLQNVWKIEEKLTEELVEISTRFAVLEMQRFGTLGFVDQYFHEIESAKVCEEEKMYCALGTPFVDDPNFDKRVRRFDKFLEFVKDFRFIRPIFNVHAIYTTENSFSELVKLRFQKYRDLWLNIHAAETRKEVYDCYNKHGKYVLEYLDSFSLLENSILAHCGWITKSEINLLKGKNSIVVHNPTSNMKLATGAHFPYVEFINAAITVALGTDGPASNNSFNMFTEMKVMSLLNKHNYWDSKCCLPGDTLKCAFAGWKIFGKDYRLVVGNDATFIVLDASNITLQPLRKDNIFSNIVYSFDGKIKESYVKGEIVFDDEIYRRKFENLMNEVYKINSLYSNSPSSE
ncbi:MAG: amidohydrolase family protein [Candidatus Woesearchaeota archaeon]